MMAPWLKASFLFISLLQVWSSSALLSDNKSWIVRRQINNPSDIEPEFEKAAAKSSRIYSMDIVSDIRLRYSSTKVTTRMANPTSQSQETTFHVVLPDTAFISGFLMEIDGKEYKASVKEKEEAKAVYEAAVSSGQTAAQVSSSARDANQFTVSVNIEAGAKISFNLTYEELLTRRRGVYEQAIHINPGSVVERLRVNVNLYEVLPITTVRVPQLRENDIQDNDDSINELAKIERHNETSVSIIYEPNETQQKKSSSNGLKGQFVVQYDIDRTSLERSGGEIHVVDGYFVHFFAPSALSILPKHVVFVLDTSGSMQGIRLEQTKQAMVSILDQLRAADIFSVVEFSSEIKEWDLTQDYKRPEPDYYWPQPSEQSTETSVTVKIPEEKKSFGSYDDIFAYQVTNASVLRAKEFVNKMEAGGSTNINGALLAALNNTQSVNTRVRLTPMIIFLTDGEATVGVTDNNDILTNLRKANSDGVVSIFSLAFGTGADFKFLTKVSTQHRGFSRKIYEAADATIQLKGFFDEVASPLLSNVRFVYKHGEKGIEEITKTKVENYFKGSEFVVAGRLSPSSIAPSTTELFTVGVNGTAVDGPYIISYPILPSPGDPPSSDNKKDKVKNSKGSSTKFSLEKIWAYLTIQEMLKNREQDDVTKEQKTNASEKALRLSLKYGFVTPVTSLVVVKPNETSTTDVRPAEPQSIAGDVFSQNYYASHFSSGGAAYAGIAPAYPSPFAHKYPAFGLTTTIRYQSNAQPTFAPEIEAEAGEELDGGFQQESSSFNPDKAEEEQTNAPSIFDPKKWIDLFPHNETHASIEFANETLSLSWENVLPDQDYDPCTLNYNNGGKGFCKSIWKCATIANEENLNSNSKCVIQNKYVGICCASSAKVTESPITTSTAIDITDGIKG